MRMWLMVGRDQQRSATWGVISGCVQSQQRGSAVPPLHVHGAAVAARRCVGEVFETWIMLSSVMNSHDFTSSL